MPQLVPQLHPNYRHARKPGYRGHPGFYGAERWVWDPDAPPCIASDERPENIFEGGGLAEDRVLAARTHEMQSWTQVSGSPVHRVESRRGGSWLLSPSARSTSREQHQTAVPFSVKTMLPFARCTHNPMSMYYRTSLFRTNTRSYCVSLEPIRVAAIQDQRLIKGRAAARLRAR